MKVYLTPIDETELLSILQARSIYSGTHSLVETPESADLILILGSFLRDPNVMLDHPCYRAFPDRCAVYTEDDHYYPIVPGIFCSPRVDQHTRAGRVFSYTYLSRNGRYQNPYLAEVQSATPIVRPKKYLFTFQGGSTSLVRKRMFNLRFNRADVLIENTSSYHHWEDTQGGREERQASYAEMLAASHFVLCPRGAGTGSIRFFEVMAAGVAPVLISDNYALPPGPDWDKFLLRVRERDIARLPEILEPHLGSAAERGRLARLAFLEHFSVRHEFDRVIELAALSLRHGQPSEQYFRKRQATIIRHERFRLWARTAFRNAILRGLRILHLKNPYQMNRP
jgi:hypothetical protein